MKKLFVLAAMSLSMFAASAQNKIGYISTDELIGVMPEAEKADAELKEYQASLSQQGQDMMKELNDKDSLFVRDSSKLSPSMKEIKKNELVSFYQRVQNWNQQAQEMYQAEAQKKIAPLRTKALDAIKSVPRSLRSGSFALGITKLETILKVVLPAALSGITASIILGVSRAVGETMTVLIAAGAQPRLTFNPLESIATMTAFMAQVSGGDAPRGSFNFKSMYAVGAVLFVITLALNMASYLISNRFKEKYD